MDSPVIKKARLDSSSRSSISLSPTNSKVDSGPSHKDVVLALAPFVCTEIKKHKREGHRICCEGVPEPEIL